jgi:hypothetical protein
LYVGRFFTLIQKHGIYFDTKVLNRLNGRQFILDFFFFVEKSKKKTFHAEKRAHIVETDSKHKFQFENATMNCYSSRLLF